MKKKNQLLTEAEVNRFKVLAGILTEDEAKEQADLNYDKVMFEKTSNPAFNRFVELVAKKVFTAGLNDPTMMDITDWGSLFENWDDFGIFPSSIEEIIKIANQAKVSQQDWNEIKATPQVVALIDSELSQQDVEEAIDELYNNNVSDFTEKGPFNFIFTPEDLDNLDLGEDFAKVHKYIKSKGGRITVDGDPVIIAIALPNGELQLTGTHSINLDEN